MIDPSLAAVLRSRYTIRRFFLVYLIALFSVIDLLFVATAHLSDNSALRAAATNFLGNFAAAIAIVILTYAFYVLITPPGLRNAELIPLRSAEITDQILDLRADASDYWFWGRSGSHLRQRVLPALDASSQEQRRHVRIRIVIPDYGRPENAIRYAGFRRGLGEDAGDQILAANVIATVAAIARVVMRNPYLEAEIGLCGSVPVLRYDISSTGALITRDARSLPAILANAGNDFYESFRDAVENEFAQAHKITWDASALRVVNLERVADVLPEIEGLSAVDPGVIEMAQQLLDNPKSRYA